MKQIFAAIVALSMVCLAMPMVLGADVTVTGTFTPNPSGYSIGCNVTSPAFGSINLGSNGALTNFAVNNTGDQNCSVTMQAGEGAGTWTLVAGTASPTGTNQFCINTAIPSGGAYVDALTERTVTSDLSPAGSASFDLKVFVGTITDEGTPGAQTFYSNLTAAALT